MEVGWGRMFSTPESRTTARKPSGQMSRIHPCCLGTESFLILLWPHGLWPNRLLCPWDFPGKNTGVGCHFLLQGIFLTQGSNLHLLHLLCWQADSLPLTHQRSPWIRPYIFLNVIKDLKHLLCVWVCYINICKIVY